MGTNPLLETPLKLEEVKKRLLGHFGTTSGQNFIYVHLNRLIIERNLNMIYISGPGHGGPALVSHVYLEGKLPDHCRIVALYGLLTMHTQAHIQSITQKLRKTRKEWANSSSSFPSLEVFRLMLRRKLRVVCMKEESLDIA
jgi:XFP N-terminal domain